MKKLKYLLPLSILAIGFLASCATTNQSKVTLKDGTVISIAGITYGDGYVAVEGTVAIKAETYAKADSLYKKAQEVITVTPLVQDTGYYNSKWKITPPKFY